MILIARYALELLRFREAGVEVVVKVRACSFTVKLLVINDGALPKFKYIFFIKKICRI